VRAEGHRSPGPEWRTGSSTSDAVPAGSADDNAVSPARMSNPPVDEASVTNLAHPNPARLTLRRMSGRRPRSRGFSTRAPAWSILSDLECSSLTGPLGELEVLSNPSRISSSRPAGGRGSGYREVAQHLELSECPVNEEHSRSERMLQAGARVLKPRDLGRRADIRRKVSRAGFGVSQICDRGFIHGEDSTFLAGDTALSSALPAGHGIRSRRPGAPLRALASDDFGPAQNALTAEQ